MVKLSKFTHHFVEFCHDRRLRTFLKVGQKILATFAFWARSLKCTENVFLFFQTQNNANGDFNVF